MTPSPFYTIEGENRYCGPSVLSALTGLTTDDAIVAVHRRLPGAYLGKGMQPKVLIAAIEYLLSAHVLRLFAFPENTPGCPRVGMMTKATRGADAMLLACLHSNHYVLMCRGFLTDSLHPKAVRSTELDTKFWGERVLAVWYLRDTVL